MNLKKLKELKELTNEVNKYQKLLDDFISECIEETELKSEVNWSHIKKDTFVLVSDDDDDNKLWNKRFFKRYTSDKRVVTYNNGFNSHSNCSENRERIWNYAKLDFEAPSLINWIPNTGIEPQVNKVVAELQNIFAINDPSKLIWDLDTHNPIIRYFILEQ